MTLLRWYGSWNQLFASQVPHKWQGPLWQWLMRQRWFLDKHATQSDILLHHARQIRIDGVTVWQILIGIEAQVYHLALAMVSNAVKDATILQLTGHEQGFVVDAWQWPPLAQWAWEQLRTGVPCPAVIIEAGASNSQIRYGEQALLKVQRVISEGIHPEVEMGEWLQRQRASMTVPLLGKLQEGPWTLGLLFAYQAGAVDGWNWFLQHGHTTSVLPHIKLLGERTRELHRQLSVPTDDPAFAPEHLTPAAWSHRQQQVATRLLRVRSMLKRHRPIDQRTAMLMKQFLQQFPNIIVDSILFTTQLHRIHGDYHLGQVLHTSDDWKIIDFEGEPLRPLMERRAKDLALRDVAGMLRSFHYGLARLQCTDPSHQTSVRQAFLAGYLLGDSFPQTVLRLLELEKALYEIEYEVRTRPDWLWIPLTAVVDMNL